MSSLTRRSEQAPSISTLSTLSIFSTRTFTSAPTDLFPGQRVRHFLSGLRDVRAEHQPLAVKPQRAHLIPADPGRIQRTLNAMHDALAIRGDVVRAEIRDVARVRGAHAVGG